MALATIFIILLITLAVIGNFWRKESIARMDAVSQTKQAQASKLLVIGRSLHDSDKAAKLAYSLASLEVADTDEARQFAVQALSQGPPGFTFMRTNFLPQIAFSPDDKWLAVVDFARFGTNFGLRLFPQNGSEPILVTKDFNGIPQFTRDSQFVVWVSKENPRNIHVWSISQKKIVRTFSMTGYTKLRANREADGIVFLTFKTGKSGMAALHLLTSGDDELRLLGHWSNEGFESNGFNQQGDTIAYGRSGHIYFRSIDDSGIGPEKFLVRIPKAVTWYFHPNKKLFYISDDKATYLFPLIPSVKKPLRVFHAAPTDGDIWFDSKGRYLVVVKNDSLLLWDLTAAEEAEPLSLQNPSDGDLAYGVAFDHQGRWMAVAWAPSSIQFYPLPPRQHIEFRGNEGGSFNVRFDPDGKSVINGFSDGVRAFSVSGENHVPARSLWKPSAGASHAIDIDRSGKYLLVGTSAESEKEGAFLVSIADGKASPLKRGLPGRIYDSVAFSPDGKTAAGVAVHGSPEQHGIEIWNLQSGDVRVIEESKEKASFSVKYSPDGLLYSGDSSGNLYQWNLKNNTHKVWKIGQGIVTSIAITNDGRYVATTSVTAKTWVEVQAATSEVLLYDLKTNTHSKIHSHGNRVFSIAFDPSGKKLVTGDLDGNLRVSSITGETPHLLIGHQSHVSDVVVDPTGKWIASTEFENPVVRLWPMPEGRPLQILPHKELVAHLRKMTNLRIISDKNSSTSHRIELVPFSNW